MSAVINPKRILVLTIFSTVVLFALNGCGEDRTEPTGPSQALRRAVLIDSGTPTKSGYELTFSDEFSVCRERPAPCG